MGKGKKVHGRWSGENIGSKVLLVIDVFADGSPNFRSILPFVEKPWFFADELSRGRSLENRKVFLSIFFVLKFNGAFRKMLGGRRLSTSFWPQNQNAAKGFQLVLENVICNAVSIFHERCLLPRNYKRQMRSIQFRFQHLWYFTSNICAIPFPTFVVLEIFPTT